LPYISAANAWPRPDGPPSFRTLLLCCDQLILVTSDFQMIQPGIAFITARLQRLLANIPRLILQVGGFKAQRSWVTALTWAAMQTLSSSSPSSSSPSSPSSSHPEQHHQAQLQQQDQLLLITGSSDGCLRLHSQSVQSLGPATVQSAGGLVEGELMQLHKTLHEADLLGVTCLTVKLCEASSSGKLPLFWISPDQGDRIEFDATTASLLCMTLLHCCCHMTGMG